MKTRTDFPRAIRLIEHAEIELSDGVGLSAMIWLPKDAEEKPVPAILEYLPYRKRDGTYVRDALTHRVEEPHVVRRDEWNREAEQFCLHPRQRQGGQQAGEDGFDRDRR